MQTLKMEKMDLLAPMAQSPWHRAGRTYVLALCLLGVLSLSGYLVTDSIVKKEASTARTVNVSGRQRMLSQRVARLCLELTMHRDIATGLNGVSNPVADEGTRVELLEAIATMEDANRALTQGSDAMGIAAPAEAVRSIYRDAPYRLDAQVAMFVGAARVLARDETSGGSEERREALKTVEVAAREPLLMALNAAVTAYQEASDRSIRHLRWVMAMMTAGMLGVMGLEAVLVFGPLYRRLKRSHERLLKLARTDPLTGCLNRRAFLERFEHEFARARRGRMEFAVLVVDIDHFKQVNDTYGHAMGDRVIEALARKAEEMLREYDVVGRIGGEEFSVLLPDAGMAGAQEVANRFRRTMESHRVTQDGVTAGVTVSVGVATIQAMDAGCMDTLNRADQALYKAKQGGRNRVCGAEERMALVLQVS